LESNWRFNVLELSMGDSDWQLAARYSLSVVIPTYVVKESATQWGVWYNWPAFGPLPVRAFGPFPVVAGFNFPYTFPVDPD